MFLCVSLLVPIPRHCDCRGLQSTFWTLPVLQNKPEDGKAEKGTAVPSHPASLSGPFCYLKVSVCLTDTHWRVANGFPPVGMLFTRVVTELLIPFAAPRRPQLVPSCPVGQKECQSPWCSAQPGWTPISVNLQPRRGSPCLLSITLCSSKVGNCAAFGEPDLLTMADITARFLTAQAWNFHIV